MVPTDITQFLLWLTTSTGVIASAMFVSWLLAQIPAWVLWTNDQAKKVIVGGVSLALAGIAWAILTYVPEAALLQLQPLFYLLVVGIAGLLGTQWWHVNVNKQARVQNQQIETLKAEEAVLKQDDPQLFEGKPKGA